MFDLGPVTQYTLGRPPLAQALAQVRFPLIAKLQTFEGVAPLQEALPEYPYMDKIAETGLAIPVAQPSAAFQSETMISWHFKDDDGRLVALNSNSLTLSLGKQYAGFTEFSDRFNRALLALQGTFPSLRKCLQIGVRFVNLIDDTGDEKGQWKRIFEPSIVGWPASEIVHGDTRLQSSVSQMQLVSPPINELADFPADIQAVIRHGIAPAKSLMPGIPPILLDDRSFFLDVDLFIAASQEFEVNQIIRQLQAMHSQTDRFFRWALTREGEKYFALEESG